MWSITDSYCWVSWSLTFRSITESLLEEPPRAYLLISSSWERYPAHAHLQIYLFCRHRGQTWHAARLWARLSVSLACWVSHRSASSGPVSPPCKNQSSRVLLHTANEMPAYCFSSFSSPGNQSFLITRALNNLRGALLLQWRSSVLHMDFLLYLSVFGWFFQGLIIYWLGPIYWA